MSDMERKLRATLFRAFCPDSAVLGEYHLGLLPETRRRELHAHLQDCPHCTRELEQLRSFMESVSADLEPRVGAGQRGMAVLRRLIARLVPPDIPSPGWSPALAGVRGEPGAMLNFSAEGYTIVLDIQVDADRPDRRSILGLLSGEGLPDFAARLYQANALVAESAVDEFGNFSINRLPPGDYALVLSGAQVEIRIEPFNIG